jgi:hypothetical protein
LGSLKGHTAEVKDRLQGLSLVVLVNNYTTVILNKMESY